MKSISARDASNYSVAKSAGLEVRGDLIERVLNNIQDPELFKLAVDERIAKLKKADKPENKLGILRKKYSRLLVLKRKEYQQSVIKAEKQKKLDKARERVHNLAYRCIQFVDKNDKSKILDKGSHPFNQWLAMAYEDKNLSIEFRYRESPYSNGYQQVKVMVNGRAVFEIEGPAFGTTGWKVKKYISGEWEKRISATKED